MNILDICKGFAIEGDIISIEPYGEGHINSTFLVETNVKKYILQMIFIYLMNGQESTKFIKKIIIKCMKMKYVQIYQLNIKKS